MKTFFASPVDRSLFILLSESSASTVSARISTEEAEALAEAKSGKFGYIFRTAKDEILAEDYNGFGTVTDFFSSFGLSPYSDFPPFALPSGRGGRKGLSFSRNGNE